MPSYSQWYSHGALCVIQFGWLECRMCISEHGWPFHVCLQNSLVYPNVIVTRLCDQWFVYCMQIMPSLHRDAT